MGPPDDIPGEAAASESANPGAAPAQPSSARPPRTVGPESEDRGGPEAPPDSLDDKPP